MKNITCPPAAKIASELNLDLETAQKIREKIKAGYRKPYGEHWSHAANAWFEEVGKLGDFNFGVESLYPKQPEIMYLNAGDTYATTLIFNHNQGRVYLGCWGDIVK